MSILMMKKNQIFKSKSKIQNEPEEYIFCGKLPDGNFFLRHRSEDRSKDCSVDSKWFSQRKIVIVNPD